MQYPVAMVALLWLLKAAAVQAQDARPAPVVVSASRAPMPDALRSSSRPDVALALDEGAARLEDLAPQVPGMQPLLADGGLTGSISLRGFAVSRFYINGLRDVNRLFVRDLATVASVQVLRGPDALAAGFNSPGGTVSFEGLRPEWQARQRITLGAGSGEGWRAGIDSTGPLPLGDGTGVASPLAYRALLQWHDGHSQPGDLRLARHTALASLAWRDARIGLLTLEAEHQHNHQPFLFGTVITDGRVRYDQLYASTAQQSRRITGRQGLHWQQAWALADGDRLQLRADAGGAQVQRDETLIGFFSQRTPDLLSGYLTRYHDAYLQQDTRLWAQWQSRLAGLPYTLSATWARSAQRFVFDGVQNIGGFDVSVQAPDFSGVDPAALRLSPRYRSEDSVERAWGLHDALQLPGGWTLQAGLGQLAYRVDADRTRAGLRPAGRVDGRTGQLGVARAWPDAGAGGLVAYLDHSRALEPNRGTTRLGDWLPPQRAVQWEAGLRSPGTGSQPGAWHLAAYRITQDNLALPDPLDRTAFITTGLRRVQGLEASGAARWGAWQWQAQAHLLQATNLRKTVPGQGDGFPGVAGRGAALRGEGPLPGAGAALGSPRLWLQWQALGPRWADLENSLRLPGHALAGAGLRWQQGSWVVNAGVHNLFNRDHVATVTALDNVYQGPQRRWWISLAGQL